MTRLETAALLLAGPLLVSGCALQPSALVALDSRRGDLRGAVATDVRIVQLRGSGPVLGVRAVVTNESERRPIVLRSGAVEIGSHLVIGRRFGLELLGGLGLGGPVSRAYSGTGVLLDAVATGLFRICGQTDHREVYGSIFMLWDIVATVRGGLWTAPAPNDHWILFEALGEVGIRLTIASDLLSSHRWRESS